MRIWDPMTASNDLSLEKPLRRNPGRIYRRRLAKNPHRGCWVQCAAQGRVMPSWPLISVQRAHIGLMHQLGEPKDSLYLHAEFLLFTTRGLLYAHARRSSIYRQALTEASRSASCRPHCFNSLRRNTDQGGRVIRA